MATARYKQLLDRLVAQIRSGALAPGTRLPTHRELARREGLALVTASRVYAELAAMGLVSGETGRGTFVRETALPAALGVDQQVVADDMVDLNFNYPALPGQADMLRNGLRQLATAGDLDALLRYQPHGGRPHERAIVAQHLRVRGLEHPGEQVLIVNGAQHGLAVTVMAMLQPGDVVAVDALSYPGFKVLAEAHRLELAPLPATPDGPDLDAFEQLCQSRAVRAIYVMPTLHNPLGSVMPAGQRQRLVELARRFGTVIIEDAAYAFLVNDAPAPLAALAPDITVYVSGFSKSVATGLRVGMVAAPAPWIAKLERAIRATTWNAPGVMTALLCNWLEDGTVAKLEDEKRRDASARQLIAAAALAGLPCQAHPTSYFVWLAMEEAVRADLIAKALLDEGISVATAAPFATTAQAPHALRLALGSVAQDDLAAVLRKVRKQIDRHRY
ncbi:PLP-dependent aminotransferase family protein [Chitinimonas sp.]|uniref:aminotransferase-like domain-containing protein n=1 Tax=Chitinimonas sp. TaxID=1934313 RepID=UPI0035B4B0BD